MGRSHTMTPFERGMITPVLCKKLCNFIIALKSYRLTLRTYKVSLVELYTTSNTVCNLEFSTCNTVGLSLWTTIIQ